MKNLIILGFTALLVACNPLDKLTDQMTSDLPSELKNRFYSKDFVGSYIKNPQDILGRLIYMYKINDSTFVYKPSMLRYPSNLGKIKENGDPVLRASGVVQINNSNELGIFLSAFNLGTVTESHDAAEIVVVDNRQVAIEGDTIQNYFFKRPLLPTETYTKASKTYHPEIIYYVRGVDITTVTAKSAKSFKNATDGSGAFFKMNNKYYAAGTGFTFDYKAGLTVDDVTSYIKSPNTSEKAPKKNPELNLSVLDSIISNIPKENVNKLKIKRLF